jgi:hypothetical protein
VPPAAPPHRAADAAPTAWRLTLQTRRSGWPAGQLARHVAQSTGVAVRPVSAPAPQWHIVELRCPHEPACRRAVKQLRQDGVFAVVEAQR